MGFSECNITELPNVKVLSFLGFQSLLSLRQHFTFLSAPHLFFPLSQAINQPGNLGRHKIGQ